MLSFRQKFLPRLTKGDYIARLERVRLSTRELWLGAIDSQVKSYREVKQHYDYAQAIGDEPTAERWAALEEVEAWVKRSQIETQGKSDGAIRN